MGGRVEEFQIGVVHGSSGCEGVVACAIARGRSACTGSRAAVVEGEERGAGLFGR